MPPPPPPTSLPFLGLPTLPAPPAPAPRNSRGLRADSSRTEQWLSNDQRWNGQWTLRPPDNLTRSRATGDDAAGTSSHAGGPAPKRKKKRRPATADAQGEAESRPSPSRPALGPIAGPSRSTLPFQPTAASTPSPRPGPLPIAASAASSAADSLPLLTVDSSASSAGPSQRRAPSGRVRAPSMSISRSQRSRLQTGDLLSRGASMRRHNVQEGTPSPAQ